LRDRILEEKKIFFMKKFEIGQGLILNESLHGQSEWYKPGVFYLKKRHPIGTLKATNNDLKFLSLRNNLISYDGYYINEIVECHNSYGEVLLCTESKFIPAPLEEVRNDKINMLLKDKLFQVD
jgi:hypothetical protein